MSGSVWGVAHLLCSFPEDVQVKRQMHAGSWGAAAVGPMREAPHAPASSKGNANLRGAPIASGPCI